MVHPLSQRLYEAVISGDTVEANSIKEDIEKRAATLNPKAKDNVVNFNTILNNDDSSARSIYNFLNKELGEDWWEWEIETLDRVLWLKFSVALEDVNRDKVLAIRHLCSSDAAFWDWMEFNQIALAFSGSIADFEMIRKPSPGMIINAIKTMNYIRPERKSTFGNDTVKYICIALIDSGVYCAPPSIKFIIAEPLSEMVSEEIKQDWRNIQDKYELIVSGKDANINEDSLVDIQAKRLVVAEASALSYGS